MKQVERSAFLKKTIFGGLLVLLPIALLAMGARWLFGLVTDMIQPLTNFAVKFVGIEIVADLLVIVGMVAVCFAVGWVVSTAGGAWFHSHFDERLSKWAPGYRMLREIVGQFFGDDSQSPFKNGEVAFVKLFGNETEVTAIVTSRHADGRFTVFMPTGPNPTSGNIYHVPPDQVRLAPDIALEDAMRTVIACGAGTGDMIARSQKGPTTDGS